MSTTDDIIRQPEYIRTIFDTVPLPIFVVDDDCRILDFNTAAAGMLGVEKSQVYRRRGGEVLHCVHSTEVPEGCGRGSACQDCVVRKAVLTAFEGNRLHRVKANMELLSGGQTKEIQLLLTASPFEHQGHRYALLILEDISELVVLRGLLPICARCKKIRDDQEYWHSLESYFHTQMNVQFTHGLCPECIQAYRQGL